MGGRRRAKFDTTSPEVAQPRWPLAKVARPQAMATSIKRGSPVRFGSLEIVGSSSGMVEERVGGERERDWCVMLW